MFNVDRCQDQRKGSVCLVPCSCEEFAPQLNTMDKAMGCQGMKLACAVQGLSLLLNWWGSIHCIAFLLRLDLRFS